LKETKEGNIYFVVDAQLDIDTEGVGLHTIPVRVLDQNRAAVRERARQMQELLKEAEKKESAEVIVEAEQPETIVRSSDEQPQLEPVLEDEEKKMNTRKRNVVWLVWILVLLIVALTLFLFWPSLEAVFEGWLYSEEELRLIQSRP
jgi:pheromone shutdown protein TraB